MSAAPPLPSLPHVLLPYQQRWVKDRARVRVAVKSRRVGWSWTVALECVLGAASSEKAGGHDAWYVGYNLEMTEEFIRDCAFWASALNAVAGAVEESLFEDDDPERKILTFTVRFASGFRITALSSRPTNLRNKKGHIVLDEAAFHDDLAGLLKSAMAVLMWGKQSRVDVISTHNGVESEFNRVVEQVRAGKLPFSLHETYLKDALREGLFKRICYVNKWAWDPALEQEWEEQLRAQYGDAAPEELDGVPQRSGGVYLARDVIERQMKLKDAQVHRLEVPAGFVHWSATARTGHVRQWLEEQVKPALDKLPQDRLHFFGEDFGRTRDRTVIIGGYLAADLRRVCPVAVELLDVPFDQQKEVLFYVCDRLPKLVKGALDATGNGASTAEAALQRYGQSVIECVSITEPWYAEHLPKLKAALDDGTLELVPDADHLIDLGAFKTVNGKPKLPHAKTPSSGQGPPRHGDAGVGVLMAHYASRLEVGQFGYTTDRARGTGDRRERESQTPRRALGVLARGARRGAGGF